MKAVFDTKPTSAYDDDLSQHYQFPRRYAKLVDQCIGDWVVLRRPRADGGNMGYFAVARVVQVEPDTVDPRLSYARLSDFLAFERPVPWTKSGRYWEEDLRNIPQPQVGVFLRGKSVRFIGEGDFSALLLEGLGGVLQIENAERLEVPPLIAQDARAALMPPPAGERNWRIEAVLSNRIIRDANFRSSVYDAYDNRCAVTRLRILDAKGNSEVVAAHIWAVDGGLDVVQNGIALAATVHWLFDHFLIALTDDYRLMTDAERIPVELRALLESHEGRIHLPSDPRSWPHPDYLTRHRNVFIRKTGFNNCRV